MCKSTSLKGLQKIIQGYSYPILYMIQSSQNSGVLVKGDDSTGNMTWYGVIRNIISLEFPQAKEVILF